MAPFLADSMLVKGWNKTAMVHRHSQLRVACCYRMVSHAATAVVSGIPPVYLLVKERIATFNRQSHATAKRKLVTNWQQEWEPCQEGRWTFRLIGDMERWLSRRFG